MTKETKKELIKFTKPIHLFRIGVISFGFAVAFGITAMIIKPYGVIDSSVLWFAAELLGFSGLCLTAASGINSIIKNKFFNFQVDADRDGINDIKK